MDRKRETVRKTTDRGKSENYNYKESSKVESFKGLTLHK